MNLTKSGASPEVMSDEKKAVGVVSGSVTVMKSGSVAVELPFPVVIVRDTV